MKFLKFLFLFLPTLFFAQKGFSLSGRNEVDIPFKLINNLIFIPVNINGVDLTFLLDSGSNESILFSLQNKDINFNDIEKINFSGLGENGDIEGLSSENNVFRIGKDMVDYNHKIYIILDENINFSSHVGIPVNGIIGYHFFNDYQIKINYSSQKISVYKNNQLTDRQLRKYEEIPMSIEKNKPYIMAGIEMTSEKVPSKMLIDLGNSDALWLFPTLIENFQYNRPNIDDYLGQGFNGDIFGKRSRIHRIYLADFVFEKPLTALPDEYSIQHLNLIAGRKGSLGNEILRRFSVIFDYPNKKLYLKKNRYFRDPFLFNASGLEIQHDGMAWEKDIVKVETVLKNPTVNSNEAEANFQYKFILKPKFSVSGCRTDSPCYIAGIRKNDKIISIDGKKAGDLSLDKINRILKEEDGTKIKFQVERDGVLINFIITLVDPIPYKDEN